MGCGCNNPYTYSQATHKEEIVWLELGSSHPYSVTQFGYKDMREKISTLTLPKTEPGLSTQLVLDGKDNNIQHQFT